MWCVPIRLIQTSSLGLDFCFPSLSGPEEDDSTPAAQMEVWEAEWGSDLPSVESQLGSHRGLHQTVEDFKSKIERAKSDEVQQWCDQTFRMNSRMSDINLN